MSALVFVAGEVDSSTPKSAATTLAQALAEGHRERISDLLHAPDETSQRVARTLAGFASASASLRRQAVETFGEDQARVLGVSPGALEAALKRIESAHQTIDGDRAVLRRDDTGALIARFVRIDNRWRLDVSRLYRDEQEIDRELRALDVQARAMRELTDEIREGKYTTALEARHALNRRLTSS